MSLVFRRVGVYLKTLVGVVVVVLLGLFFVADAGNRADIWLFGQRKGEQGVSTNLIVLFSLIAGVLLWWLGKWMVTLPGQWRLLGQDARRQDQPSQ